MEETAHPQAHAIVLAGAYSTGRCVLERLAPRPLLPVAQQPLVTYALRWLASGGLRHATICANSAARAIRASLKDWACGLRLDYLEDWSPRGPAGCVRDAGIRTAALSFVVVDGTSVPVLDLRELIAGHHASGAALTVVVGADGDGRLRPTGAYVFARRTLAHVPAEGFQDIKEKLVPRLSAAGEQVSTYRADAVAPRVVDAETYLALDQWIVARTSRLRAAPDGFRRSGEAVLHDTARVDPTSRLIGPVLLGPAVTVSAGATLVGPVSIGRGTTVGAGAVVSRSLISAECTLGDRSFVDRSMLADSESVEAGATLVAAMRTGVRGRASGLGRGARAPRASFPAAMRPAAVPRS